MMPVRLSVCLPVTEVHWRIIANLCFKFRSNLPRIAAAVLLAGAVLLAVLLAGESSRAMLASARLSCSYRYRAKITRGLQALHSRAIAQPRYVFRHARCTRRPIDHNSLVLNMRAL